MACCKMQNALQKDCYAPQWKHYESMILLRFTCKSSAGFQWGSKMTTRLAAVRLSPTPPAAVEIRKAKTPGLWLKSSTCDQVEGE